MSGMGSSRHYYGTSLDHMTAQIRHLIEQIHSVTQSHIDQSGNSTWSLHFHSCDPPSVLLKRIGETLTLLGKILEY